MWLFPPIPSGSFPQPPDIDPSNLATWPHTTGPIRAQFVSALFSARLARLLFSYFTLIKLQSLHFGSSQIIQITWLGPLDLIHLAAALLVHSAQPLAWPTWWQPSWLGTIGSVHVDWSTQHLYTQHSPPTAIWALGQLGAHHVGCSVILAPCPAAPS